MQLTAAEMATELRLIWLERKDAITRLKSPEEAARRSGRLSILAEIGKFIAANSQVIDEIIARSK